MMPSNGCPEIIAIDGWEKLYPQAGVWKRAVDRIEVAGLRRRDLYRAPEEPSFVCWAIVWQESDGTVKLSFTEAVGDSACWPPGYDFTRRGITYYLKTLQSADGGMNWRDTGWKEPLDPHWIRNSDHHIRHVIEMPDGTLLRNYKHSDDQRMVDGETMVYDDTRLLREFPFRPVKAAYPATFFTLCRSIDRGRSWETVYQHADPELFITGLHRLRNGLLIATGALRSSGEARVVIMESADSGVSWSPPRVLAENGLIAGKFCEESDFVELPDGRLLLVNRVVGQGVNVQMYLTRNAPGDWTASEIGPGEGFVKSGYPFLLQTSDGTIFYDDTTCLRYSCDQGRSWQALALGYTYYGQLLETAPGKILWVFQNNIGDGYYPWKHDAAIRQVTFDYRRIGVAGQSDAAAANALCRIGQNDYTGCHLYAGIKVGHSAGLAFAIRQNSFYFVTVAREDGDQGRNEFPAALVVGYCEGGKITILRKTYAGNIPPGCRIEMQLDWQPERLKCAVKWNDRDWNSGDSPAVYCNLRHSFGAGGVGLYCDRGTAEFQNLRLTPSGGVEIRSNWAHGGDGQKVIPLDAGKEEL